MQHEFLDYSGTISAGFYANFTVVQGIGSYISYLNPAYTLSNLIAGTAYGNLQLTNATETSTKPAEAILLWTIDLPSPGGSTTGYIKLRIQNGNLTTPYFV